MSRRPRLTREVRAEEDRRTPPLPKRQLRLPFAGRCLVHTLQPLRQQRTSARHRKTAFRPIGTPRPTVR